MKADLHVHSTASDGTLTPSQLVSLARESGVDVLAIADHDSVGGVAEGLAAARQAGITLIPAVELSAVDDRFDVHILAYHVDIANVELLAMLADLRAARLRRATAMVEALRQSGLDISIDDVLAISDGGAVGRSHIARALVAAGHAESVSEGFRRFIGRGQSFYRPKESRRPAEVIADVRRLGAVPVLAHPGVTRVDELIPGMIASGLLGIEAYHADHSAADRERYAAVAAEHGLLVTGGTDFHGPQGPNPALGSTHVPEAAVRALLARGERAG